MKIVNLLVAFAAIVSVTFAVDPKLKKFVKKAVEKKKAESKPVTSEKKNSKNREGEDNLDSDLS